MTAPRQSFYLKCLILQLEHDLIEPNYILYFEGHMQPTGWPSSEITNSHKIATSIYGSFATKVSQPKISYFSGETFRGFEVLYFSTSATTTQLLSSG